MAEIATDKARSDNVQEAIKEHEIDDVNIQSFLRLISQNTLNDKSERDTKNELIRALFEEGFNVNNPSGTKKIGSKVIQQGLWRVMSKIKFLNYTIHGTGQSSSVERLVTEGFGTVADRGELTTCFRDKGGVFQNSFLYGNGYLMFGKGENDDNPVTYRVLRNEDVYVDHLAFGIRGVRPANEMVVIYGYDKQEAYELWPELEEEGVIGRIPGTYQDHNRESDREEEDLLEVAWGYNIAKRKHISFAGVQAYELDRFEDEEYPYVKNSKPYIPVFNFLCQPSADGFFDHGIGDMFYELALITRKLLNMEVGHIEENVYPITLINAPQSKVDELVEKMAMANKARAAGLKPFVAHEFSTSGGQQSVGAQSLLTQNLFNEWQAVWDRLYKEMSRLGINLDDADRGSGYTRGQVIAEEESSNAFIKQMQEYNASETQELIECSLDAITEYVSTRNKSPLNLITRIKLDDGTTERLDEEVTMGMLSKTLKNGNWFAVTDSRTGAITSDLMKMIKLEGQMQITAPGTPEYSELYRELAQLRGLDLGENNPAPPPPEAPQEGAPEGAPPGSAPTPPPSETERVLPPPVSGLAQPI